VVDIILSYEFNSNVSLAANQGQKAGFAGSDAFTYEKQNEVPGWNFEGVA
jgi:hypothetical protein